MSFNYNTFVSKIHAQFNDSFSIDEVKQLLYVDEYLKDSPVSTGQRLIIENLLFSGEKGDGTEFCFSHKFEAGVNVLIADNLKGKSSIFKIIRFALTGKNIENIGHWLKHILLSFKVNNHYYSVYIDCSNHRLKAQLLKGNVLKFDDTENAESYWTVSRKEDYSTKLQEFFYTQFSYYSLKWTQKPSQKEKVGLQENSTSWKTYFHSIFLESKDSYELSFGNQELKIFEMLFGLELTYPINNLTIKLDKLKSEKGLVIDQVLKTKEQNEKLRKQIEADLKFKREEYNKAIQPINKEIIDTGSLYELYESLTKKVNEENQRLSSARKAYNTLEIELENLRIQKEDITKKTKDLIKERLFKVRKINDLNEYKDSLFFFSNLEIKHCPNCDHKVSSDRLEKQVKEHKCSLCSEEIKGDNAGESQENFKSRIEDINNNVSKIDETISQFQVELIKVNELKEGLEKKMKLVDLLPRLDLHKATQDVSNVESKIKSALENNKEVPRPNTEMLLKDIAVLEYRIQELKLELDSAKPELNSPYFEDKIKLLEAAIAELKLMRFKIGNDSITKLEDIMLSKVKSFGIKNIEKIRITEGLGIRYIQDNISKEFKNLVEGEQLRAKISLYLSLIELDISERLGKHTRFLVIDSPAKEEGDKYYLAGLISELQNIDNRLGDELQILIGTAERGFERKFTNELIFSDEQFVF